MTGKPGMKYWMVYGLFALALLVVMCKGNDQVNDTDLKSVRMAVLQQNKNFETAVDDLIVAVGQHKRGEELQMQFDTLRSIYKSMEWAVAYFMPETARFLNGPNLDEIEMEEHTVLEAEGLQTLEEYFYPEYDSTQQKEILRFLKKLKNKSLAIDTYFEVNTLSLPQTVEALRNQLFRITTLGITGFDTPISGHGLSEAIVALNAVGDVFMLIKPQVEHTEQIDQILTFIDDANRELGKGIDKDHFDYLSFIDGHLNQLSDALFEFRKLEGIAPLDVNYPIHPAASNLFSDKAFNPDFFVASDKHKMSGAKVLLGARLFRDNLLSGDQTRSCISCHHADKAFSDGLKVPLSLSGRPMERNTPSLSYSNYQHGQFWDMRREDLEGQSTDVITNKDEMHGDMIRIAERLNSDRTYRHDFKHIYQTDSIQGWQLQNALASYIRSLAVFRSSFDQYMKGDKQALTQDEKEGFNLFVGKGKCATCHFIPLFNGTVPPEYSKTESEVLGVADDHTNAKMDTDSGRGRYHSTVAQLQHAFKTPTVRNSSKTAPYMHNGGYKTLEQVMDFYNQGGGQQFGFAVENQTLPTDSLHLTAKETAKIIAFIKALEDE